MNINIKPIITNIIISAMVSCSAHAALTEEDAPGLMRVMNLKYAHLSPLNGLGVWRSSILSNIRFHGNFGPESSDYMCHKQIKRRHQDCPRDHRSALLQHFFPSPIGHQLVANNAPEDPIRTLLPRTIGTILKIINDIQEHTQVPLDHLDELALGMFKVQYLEVYTQLKTEFEERKKASFKKERKSQQSNSPEQARITKLNIAIKKQMMDLKKEKKSSEEIKEILTPLYEERRGLIAYLGKQKEESTSQIRDEYRGDLSSFMVQKLEKNQNFRGLHRVAHLILNALTEGQGFASTEYPPRFVENVILAFLWKKANFKEDLVPFFEALGPQIVSSVQDTRFVKPEAWNMIYDKKTYDDFKKDFKEGRPADIHCLLINPELTYFVTLSFDLYEHPFPQNVGFNTAYYPLFSDEELRKIEENDPIMIQEQRERGFSDCGEASLWNFLNAMIFDPKKQNFDMKLLKLIAPNASPDLFEFFQSQTPGNIETKRDQWSHRTSGIQSPAGGIDIIYSKKRGCDIQPSMANLLEVLTHLLNDKVMNVIDPGLPKEKRSALKLDRLCELITQAKEKVGEEFELTWRVKDAEKEIMNDTATTIEFLINDESQFEWNFTESHFSFHTIEVKKNADWRHEMGPSFMEAILEQDAQGQGSSLVNLLPFYIASDKTINVIDSIFHQPTEKKDRDLKWVSPLIYHGNFLSTDGILEAMQSALYYLGSLSPEERSQSPFLHILSHRWIPELPQDMAACSRLFYILAESGEIGKIIFERVPEAVKEQVFRIKDYANGSVLTHIQDIRTAQFIFSTVPPGELKAELFKPTKMQHTPLHHAVNMNEEDFARLIINEVPSSEKEFQFKPNRRGRTPLHYVKTKGMAQLIIENAPTSELKAGLFKPNRFQETPLRLATGKNLIDYLQEQERLLAGEENSQP